MNWQERLEDAEDELQQVSEELSRVKLERDMLSQVVRDLQKQAAAMREALIRCDEWFREHTQWKFNEQAGPRFLIAQALSSDAGLSCIPRESVKPLVEALRKHHEHASESCNVFFEQDGKPIEFATDLGESYQESELCEKTCDALRAFPQ